MEVAALLGVVAVVGGRRRLGAAHDGQDLHT